MEHVSIRLDPGFRRGDVGSKEDEDRERAAYAAMPEGDEMTAFEKVTARILGPQTVRTRDSVERMPVISIFFGIVIRMYYEDHDPAHFHAEYQGERAKFDLGGRMIAGHIRSATARRRIAEWATLHRAALEANWQSMRLGRPLDRIEPLN